jgi:threonine/homoserine/homoserine lactone efflux protein
VDLELILLTMAVGIAIEAPLGAVNLIVIRATLRSGLGGGLAAASGSILGDAIFAAAIAFGIREVGDLVVRYGLILQIAGGLLLLVMGIETFRTHIADRQLKLDSPPRDPLWRKAVSAFVLTVTNPATFMGMVAIFGGMASMIHLASAPLRPWLALIGVMAGALIWWLFVTIMVTSLRKRLTGATLDRLNHWAGVGIFGFGLAVLANVAFRFV